MREAQGMDAYWRRRVYVLAAALTVIGLIAWSCSASGHKKNTAQTRDAAVATSFSPFASRTASPSTSPSATVTKTASPAPSASARKRRLGDACDGATVVVNLTVTKTTYRPGDHPRFQVSVVNTDRMPCTVDVGPKGFDVRVVSGSDRIWSTASCGGGPGSNIQSLKRGVPYILTVDWNRRRCGAGQSLAQAGTYVVSAPRTHPQVFFLH